MQFASTDECNSPLQHRNLQSAQIASTMGERAASRTIDVQDSTPGGARMRREGRVWLTLALLWLAGNSLRMTILAVPPVLPAIHRDLHLDETLVGALTALPVLLLAVAAVPGSLLIARIGPRRALLLGLVAVSVAGALRGLGNATLLLFAMTFLMGVGIAVSQPALPSLVREWLPSRTGLGTAVFSNGFLIGEIVAASLTVPLILPLLGNHWQPALAFWSLPVLLTAAAIQFFTRQPAKEPHAIPARWWPDWGSGRTWRLGLILGCASIDYFGSNAFIPDYVKATQHPQLISAALTSLNFCQLPASLLAATLGARIIARRWPFVMAGALALISTAGFKLGGSWVVAGAGLLGFSSGLVFVLSLALPPLLADAGDVHRLSAAMFSITYACSFAGSLVGGAIWDATRIPLAAFIPILAAGSAMIILVAGVDLSAARHHLEESHPLDWETEPPLVG
jgi:CP family cyanate transporter-like MFS transporter